jgi:hypothetical protein
MRRRTVLKLALSAIGLAATPVWATESLPPITLYKDPQCSCCGAYTDYLRVNGFTVTVVETVHLPLMYAHYSVANAYQSCHLATVSRYFTVGHIPVEFIKRMLAEQPAFAGITLPGMPVGAPGMGGNKTEPFKIYALGDGPPKLYAAE